MKFDFIWAVVLAAIALLIGLYLTSLVQFAVPKVNPTREAARIRLEADQLKDSAAVLQDAVLPVAAQELMGRTAELNEQAELLSQAKPLPAGQLSEQFTTRAKALSDSAYLLRNAFLTRNDSITQNQERRIARIDWTARNLKALANRLGSWGLNTSEQTEFYDACILTYGEGARVCEQLRSEVPAGH
jgi:hypothetical protein